MNPEKYETYFISNYKIEFIRYPSQFYYTQFSQYTFIIKFIEKDTNNIILSINANEKYMYDFIVNMYQYNMYSSDVMSSERVWFSPDVNGNRYIAEITACYEDYPTELEFSIFTIFEYSHITDTVIPRITIKMDEYQIEEMLMQAFKTLEGLDYLSKIQRSEVDDYLDFLGLNNDAINFE